MKKIKNSACLLIVLFSLNGCSKFDFTDDEPDPIPSPVMTLSVDPVDTTKEANGLGQFTIKVATSSKAIIDEDKRKITISTDNGNFLVNGELKKKIELVLKDDLTNEVVFVNPREACTAKIELFSFDGILRDSETLTFTSADPTAISVEIPFAEVKYTTVITIKSILSRAEGLVSPNLRLIYQLFDSKSTEIKNASFFETTASDSSQNATAKLQLGNIEAGTYTIKAFLMKADGKADESFSGSKSFVVIK